MLALVRRQFFFASLVSEARQLEPWQLQLAGASLLSDLLRELWQRQVVAALALCRLVREKCHRHCVGVDVAGDAWGRFGLRGCRLLRFSVLDVIPKRRVLSSAPPATGSAAHCRADFDVGAMADVTTTVGSRCPFNGPPVICGKLAHLLHFCSASSFSTGIVRP